MSKQSIEIKLAKALVKLANKTQLVTIKYAKKLNQRRVQKARATRNRELDYLSTYIAKADAMRREADLIVHRLGDDTLAVNTRYSNTVEKLSDEYLELVSLKY